jgi:hypothetical protein
MKIMKRKTMKVRFSLALISLIASTSALAGTDNIFGSWTSVTLRGDFGFISPEGENFQWVLIDQARTRDDKDLNPTRYPDASGFSPRFSDNFIWAEVGYNLTKHTSIWLGYTHHWSKLLSGGHFQENRPYEQLIWSDEIGGGFKLTMRSRLEQMFLLSGTGSDDDPGVGVRIRQLALLSHPISAVPGLSAYVGDEVWVRINNTKAFGQGGFQETRPMAGLTYQATKHVGFNLGYLGQFIDNRRGNDLFTHNVLFDISYKF